MVGAWRTEPVYMNAMMCGVLYFVACRTDGLMVRFDQTTLVFPSQSFFLCT